MSTTTHFVARAAPIARGHIGARQTLSPAGVDAVLGDIATAAGGQALALWRSNVAGADPVPGQQPRLFASVRATGTTAFGAPEAVGGDTSEVFSAPTALVDPVTGHAVALFADLQPTSGALVSVR